MANTRFKTENGLLVTGGNAQFEELVSMANSLIVDGDLVLIRGDLQVTGTQVFSGGQVYTADIVADVDGLKLGNTTNQFDAFLGTTRIYDALIPVGNTVPLGNATNRWVITANTLNLSGDASITGTVTLSNTLSATGAVTFANTLAVTGIITGSSNVNIDSGVLFVDALNNRIGINNTAPAVTLRVSGDVDITGGVNAQGYVNVGTQLIVGGVITAAANVNVDSGVLFVDAVNNRVGINNTAPGVALRVTGAVDMSSTANVQGNANVGGTLGVSGAANVGGTLGVSGAANALSTLGVSGAANALSTLGVNGLLTAAAGLNATGSVNASANLNVGTYATGTVNGVNITNNALIIGNTTANAILTGSSLSINSTSASLNVGTSFTVNSTSLTTGSSANANFDSGVLFVDATNNRVGINNTAPGVTLRVTGAVDMSSTANIQGNANVGGTLGVAGVITAAANVNVDSGVLFVDATNNRVGINNTAPGVALRVTGDADISSTANIQGNANVGGTLGVNGAVTIANTLTLNDTSVLSVPIGTVVSLRSGKNHTTASQFYNIISQTKLVNTAAIASRGLVGVKSEIVNESMHRNADGVTLYNPSIYGTYSYAYNGNTTIVTDARTSALYGVYGEAVNYANGSVANTVGTGAGGIFLYESSGSGVTTTAYGTQAYVQAANNTITGNITTAYGVRSFIRSNTAMTIDTGYLFHGQHLGSTTTNKYGLYIEGESNNYFSGNVHVASTVNAASYRIGAGSLVINATTIALGPFGTTNGVNITTTSIDVGNTVANAALDYNIVYVANSTARANLNPISLSLGNTTVNSIVNSSSILVGSIGVSNGFLTNTSTIIIGNTSVNAVVTSTSLTLGNTTVNSIINSSSLAINSNAAIRVPVGTTLQRPADQIGLIRYNTTINQFEGYGAGWGTIGGGAGGGGSDQVFYENEQTVTTNYTISTNKNAMSAGPITINNGVTVTIPTNSRWVIV